MSGWGSRWDGPPDSYYDPPDDPPLIACPECEGVGGIVEEVDGEEVDSTCPRCKGDGADFATPEEVRDHAAEAEIERAEARRDGDL